MASSDYVNSFSESEATELWRVTTVLEDVHALPEPRASVLEEDADLWELVPPSQRAAAVLASRAALVEAASGQWDARSAVGAPAAGFGLLILDGVLVRRVDYEGRTGAEVLADGDLLPPWELQSDGSGPETSWRALSPARLAVLDAHWTERMQRFTRIAPALSARALERSARLAAMMAITQVTRLDERLWRLLWALADRHGRVRRDGVHLDLPLTHEVLAQLSRARRPPVTSALTRLVQQGRVLRTEHGWLLRGAPPDTA